MVCVFSNLSELFAVLIFAMCSTGIISCSCLIILALVPHGTPSANLVYSFKCNCQGSGVGCLLIIKKFQMSNFKMNID